MEENPMSDDLDETRLHWRDTYFVWFPAARRPKLSDVEKVLRGLPEHFELRFPEQDDDGGFESITLLSSADHSALEISFLAGADLREQAQALAEEIKENGDAPPQRLAKLASCDARFDIMLFEQVEEDEEEDDEMFDPSTLLVVLDALAKQVDGIGVDPQSGLLA
jgi:hypothetical protein